MSEYRFAMLAYPPDYREERGPELVGLANRLAGDRWSIRQSLGLVAGGLRTRARTATHGSTREVWASGIRIGLLFWLVMGAASGFVQSTGSESIRTSNLSRGLVMLQLPALLALTISTRWWSAALLTMTQGAVLVVAWTSSPPIVIDVFGVAMVATAVILSGLAWWLAIATDGHRAASPTAVGLLILGTIAIGISPVAQFLVPVYLVLSFLLFFGGLIGSRHDPRLAAAGTTVALLLSPGFVTVALFNDATGWNYWGPITISLAVLATLASASISGTRRLRTA